MIGRLTRFDEIYKYEKEDYYLVSFSLTYFTFKTLSKTGLDIITLLTLTGFINFLSDTLNVSPSVIASPLSI